MSSESPAATWSDEKLLKKENSFSRCTKYNHTGSPLEEEGGEAEKWEEEEKGDKKKKEEGKKWNIKWIF